MTDTPETDAILKQFEHLLPNWLASEMAAVARKLERERDELRKALSLAGKLCHEVHHSKSMQHGDLDPYSVEALIQRARNQDS
jgi:hypothetical protein